MAKTADTFPWHRIVEGPTSCWLWTGPLSNFGYGRLGTLYVHRLVYELMVAAIPEGLHMDHLCRNRRCCNPWHLEPVSARVNVLRGAGPSAACAAMTHCPKGHPFDEDNTYVTPAGRRQCRTCRSERWDKYAERRKAGLAPPRARAKESA
jgi:hypothetical protein